MTAYRDHLTTLPGGAVGRHGQGTARPTERYTQGAENSAPNTSPRENFKARGVLPSQGPNQVSKNYDHLDLSAEKEYADLSTKHPVPDLSARFESDFTKIFGPP